MPKSKNRKKHSEKLNLYKSNKKKEQELFKKKMIDNYIKMQQESLAGKEDHTSTQDASGPDINIDDLNEDWGPINQTIDPIFIENVEPVIEFVEDPLVGGYVKGLDANGNLMNKSINNEENDNNN